jgi:hypothetical protein
MSTLTPIPIYLRFFNAVFAKGVDDPTQLFSAKWVISPEVPAVDDDPETPEDESSERIPEEKKFYKPVFRRALSLVAARAGLVEY